MKLLIFGLIVVFFVSSRFAQGQGVSSTGFAKKGFNYSSQFGFKEINLEIGQSIYQLDVINMFSNHLITSSRNTLEQRASFKFPIISDLDLLGSYMYAQAEYRNSSVNDLEKVKLSYYDYDYGFMYPVWILRMALTYGSRSFHTFLETDTTFYFHDKLGADYVKLYMEYNYPLEKDFKTIMHFSYRQYLPGDSEGYEIDKGFQREIGVKFLSGSTWKWGLGFSQVHHNIKLVHDFFGLDNEMNNKLSVTRMSLLLNF